MPNATPPKSALMVMDELSLHHALLLRSTWPGDDGEVRFCETHASRIYLVGERVYKVKKPVNFGFLDFTTLERRTFYCREEVRLNNRFAPGTYLGVGELRRTRKGVELGEKGTLVEVAVIMRRLPAERMLDHLLEIRAAGLAAAMERLGTRLAHLHATSPICRGDSGSDRKQVGANWRENFEQTWRFVPDLLTQAGQETAKQWIGAFLENNRALLEEREAAGFVRDGHGDLHSAHVCLTEPLQIFDCIEFNPRFRIADTAADLAFLLMDLDFLNRRDLGVVLLEAYRGAGGPNPGPDDLITFYKLYRAWVRGKVEGLLAVAPTAEASARAHAATLARRYFALAQGYLLPRVLLLTCGLMGSGKSTIARALARTIGAEVLRSDQIRKDLAGAIGSDSDKLPFGTGIYAEDMNTATYRRLLELAIDALRSGPVIIDAAFGDAKYRQEFLEAAQAQSSPVFILHCRCPAPEALSRLAVRQQDGNDISDGRVELYAQQAAVFQAPKACEPCTAVDTTMDVDYNVQLIISDLLVRLGMSGKGTCLNPLHSPVG